MSETKHTPGPWIASQPAMGFSEIRQESTGKLIFALAHPSTTHGDGEISDEEKYANLAMLAAAPDMMDALKVAHATIHALAKIHDPAWQIYMSRSPEVKMILAAIAKAEGRA